MIRETRMNSDNCLNEIKNFVHKLKYEKKKKKKNINREKWKQMYYMKPSRKLF